ncbi:tRNA (adenosine(37)-N6)-dimethylallyltransferase MiaA [Paludibacterium sp. B53371]|uniref:tRNA (adenosine(37)-N6)-dimethylallyltransferase MiaA n=1 Tax=Paludibacterium sp. B53371 TaxID=2806263 RepID=UPI001C05B675|nr:tRNA (adenosine(37)-N6)-dimethylallyltransferase MiaA [Paludibacterium sp. B53371]
MQDKVLMLMGPTASGKTALALALAQHLPIEIISVDSALVYRDMDIGTAKPSRAEQASCPHHLIDIISPLESYSAAQFCSDTERLIDEIHARGHIPLLAGGTMLYYKALLQGLSELPQADPDLRARLDAEAAEHGWPALHARLATLDPVTAARLQPGDAQRIQRALEVCLLSGQPMSSLLDAEAQRPQHRWQSLNLALVPAERSWLHERIAQRFALMLADGFLDEVSRLRQTYPDLHPGLPSMRCVGYRQAWEYQDGHCSHEEMVARGIAATRQLCKRQLTWIRSLETIPVNAQSDQTSEQVIRACNDFLAGRTICPDLRWQGAY